MQLSTTFSPIPIHFGIATFFFWLNKRNSFIWMSITKALNNNKHMNMKFNCRITGNLQKINDDYQFSGYGFSNFTKFEHGLMNIQCILYWGHFEICIFNIKFHAFGRTFDMLTYIKINLFDSDQTSVTEML